MGMLVNHNKEVNSFSDLLLLRVLYFNLQVTRNVVVVMNILCRWLEEFLSISVASKEDTSTDTSTTRDLTPRGQGTSVMGPQEPKTLELGIVLTQETAN